MIRLVAFAVTSVLLAVFAMALPGETVPVTIGIPNFGPMGNSNYASISADGRYVAFRSEAPGLAPIDTNGAADIFVTDRQTGITTLVSVGMDGTSGNGSSSTPMISANGRYVTFISHANNLVSGDTNIYADVFVRDLSTGTTTLISKSSTGVVGNLLSTNPSISADGKYIAFESLASNLIPFTTIFGSQIYVWNSDLGTLSVASISYAGFYGSNSNSPSISADGRYVAFESSADYLVPNDTNSASDIFIRDMVAGSTVRASVSSAGAQANSRSFDASISGDGHSVAFSSYATNLVSGTGNGFQQGYVRNLVSSTTKRVSVSPTGALGNGDTYITGMSGDGRYVAFWSYASNLVLSDHDTFTDVFVRDLVSNSTSVESLSTAGIQGNSTSYAPFISSDGQFVVFESQATNFTVGDMHHWSDVFLRDRTTGQTSIISVATDVVQGSSPSEVSGISEDGRFVVFSTYARNLVEGEVEGRQIYLRDLLLGTTKRLNVNAAGQPGNGSSAGATFSKDGRFVAFSSSADNLVAEDTNGQWDVFVRDLTSGKTTLASVDSNGVQGNGPSDAGQFSADGRYLVMQSYASNLVPGDTNNKSDVFFRDLVSGTVNRVSVDSLGGEANGYSFGGSLSDDGALVVFSSDASNLVEGDTNGAPDVFTKNLKTGVTERVSLNFEGSQANGGSDSCLISGDGRYVVFTSKASDLVAGDDNNTIDVFRRDLISGATERVSVGSFETPAGQNYYLGSISTDGRYIAFTSDVTSLIPDDTNKVQDVFIRDMLQGKTTRASVDSYGNQANDGSDRVRMTSDARFVAFSSSATNLTHASKLALVQDIFRHEVRLENTVTGTVSVPGYIADLDRLPVDFVLVSVRGGTTTHISNVKMTSDGSYCFSTAATGRFRVLARVKGSLWREYSDVIYLNSSTYTDVNFELRLGDCNGDNYVGTDDYLIFNSAFDCVPGDEGFDLRADLNGDGRVCTDDYMLLNENFDAVGDQAPQANSSEFAQFVLMHANGCRSNSVAQ